jgi:hypothetical protein
LPLTLRFFFSSVYSLAAAFVCVYMTWYAGTSCRPAWEKTSRMLEC